MIAAPFCFSKYWIDLYTIGPWMKLIKFLKIPLFIVRLIVCGKCVHSKFRQRTQPLPALDIAVDTVRMDVKAACKTRPLEAGLRVYLFVCLAVNGAVDLEIGL